MHKPVGKLARALLSLKLPTAVVPMELRQYQIFAIFTGLFLERVTVVKFRVDNRGSNGTGCFRIKVRTDTAELTNMKIAGLRK